MNGLLQQILHDRAEVQQCCSIRSIDRLEMNPLKGYPLSMTLLIPPEQRKWLEAQVAAGHFASVDAAAQAAIASAMVDQAQIEADDLDWARGEVEQARADVARGGVVSLAEHRASIAALLDSFER